MAVPLSIWSGLLYLKQLCKEEPQFSTRSCPMISQNLILSTLQLAPTSCSQLSST